MEFMVAAFTAFFRPDVFCDLVLGVIADTSPFHLSLTSYLLGTTYFLSFFISVLLVCLFPGII
jgi:hypothetical protein